MHYEDRAVQHLLAVACGLDSMVVGESQILGQVRAGARRWPASRARSTGRCSELGALALRAGKRAHAETGIDRAGPAWSASAWPRPRPAGRRRPARGRAGAGLAGRPVLVVGAGLDERAGRGRRRAAAGAAGIVVANRTRAHGRAAGRDRAAATAADLTDLPR